MRPSHILFLILLFFLILDTMLYLHATRLQEALRSDHALQAIAVSGLGLADLCVATEARYTRHPAVSDAIAPFMDHPGAIEHFPSGSFWAAPADNNVR